MTSYKVSISENSICKKTLVWLWDHSEINKNDLFEVENSIEGMAASQVIKGVVNIEPEIAEGTKIRLMQRVLTEWKKKEQVQSADDLIGMFKQIIKREILDLEKNKSPFTILAFLNIESQSIKSLNSLTVMNCRLQFPQWSEIENLDIDKFWKAVEIHLIQGGQESIAKRILTPEGKIHFLRQKHDFVPVTAQVEAVDENTALYIALDSLDLVRAVFNFPSSLSLFRKYGNSSAALSRFLPSPIYGVFGPTGEFNQLFHITESYKYRQQKLSPDSLEYCINLLNDLQNANPGDLKHLIAKSLKLYQQAFDFSDYQATYLGLWQILEILTLNEPSKGRTQIDKRVACLLALRGDDVLRDAIALLMQSRNTLVHSGIFPDYSGELVFTLKGIIDEMLIKIIEISAFLTTEFELSEYYRLVSKSNVDFENEIAGIDATKNVIDFIKNVRNVN